MDSERKTFGDSSLSFFNGKNSKLLAWGAVFIAFSVYAITPGVNAAAWEQEQASGVTISIFPTYSTITLDQPFQFSATVRGTKNSKVTWQVNNANGGARDSGTISSSGLYTPPSVLPNPAAVTIRAVSQADPSKSATAVLTLVKQRATGTTHYVSTSGNDRSPGTFTNPWRTIQHAADSVSPGDTVYVLGGVYNEVVTMKTSGSAKAGFITFSSYPGELATVDGTGLKIPGGQWGLFTMESKSYIVINGFEIRNYKTNKLTEVPIGVYIFGAGSNLQIVNNHVHNIETHAKTNPKQCGSDAFGITVNGTKAPPSVNALAIVNNEVDHNKTGCSETVSVNGNVESFTISNNLIHDDDNIGIDAIGFEGVCRDPLYDQARKGEIRGNTVYNITSYGNPDYGKQYAADGIYVDGGTQIVVEQNLIHHVDLGIELASEMKTHMTSHVIARNNVVYLDNSVGISIGGAGSDNGGTDRCVIVNNTLFKDGTKGSSGEFQIQYHATRNLYENNIAYANRNALFLNNFTSEPTGPAQIDYNLYYSILEAADGGNWTWQGKNYLGYDHYRLKTKLDKNSPPFSDPDFVRTGNPPNLELRSGSPAIGAGHGLGVGLVGAVDFAGNPRVTHGGINIGAYQK